MILIADCLEALGDLDADSLDVCITDPPYGLRFLNQEWDRDISFDPDTWRAVLRALKPGAYLAAFGAPASTTA